MTGVAHFLKNLAASIRAKEAKEAKSQLAQLALLAPAAQVATCQQEDDCWENLASLPCPDPDLADNRRTCDCCARLQENGQCLAADMKEIAIPAPYFPELGIKKRCGGFQPSSAAPNQRKPQQLWPQLFKY